MTASFTGWSKFDYSLPFTRAQTLNVAPGVDLNLSRQVFNAAGTLLRSEYVFYERDPNPLTAAPSDAPNTNRRVVRSRTVFHDDGDNFAGMINSDFDGLGHYRQQQTEGSFPGSNVRTHFANYNPARGTYVVNQGANTGSGFTVFPPGTPWVTETMTFTSDSEGGATARTELCYAPNSTAVVRQRVHRLDGAAQGAADLVSVYDVDGAGNVISEKSYGGDSQAVLPTGGADLCTMGLPANPKYQIDHTYAFGARATSRYSGTSHFILNQGIDFNTGLVASSTDPPGLLTNFEHDLLGRLTWSKPSQGHGGWTEAVYAPAAGTQRATVTLRHRDNGSKSAPVLQTEFLLFDGFGRIFQEQRQLPSGQVNKRETLYDGAGNKASVSELATGTPSNRTQFLDYDPFGRPGVIRPPDGTGHDVTMTYLGVRQVDRTVKIATSSGSETAATTTEVYDRHGRLLSVTESSGSGGANVTTTYGYDVGNRLSSVSTTAGSTTQNRAFNYDRAGLLTSETHPEKGTSGNGSVTYPQYDARGHVLHKIDGPNDLTFSYDPAERLLQVRDGSNRLLKDFVYASSNGFNDFSQGKLRQAARFNYVTLGGTAFTVQVTETYTYGGHDGRVSQRDTSVITIPAANPTSGTFTQGFSYTALGQVSALDFPVCTHPDCTLPVIFGDVPAGHPDRPEIEAIFPGITAGCGGGNYCPNDSITRGTMAVYLLLGKEGAGYTPPPCTTPMFADVPCSSPFAPWINELARRGITAGCGGGKYCPQNAVTNAEMSVFLLATLLPGFTPPLSCPPFLDVDCASPFAKWIAEEARRGIMPGCGGGLFCPTASTTRAKMAGMITRAFDIPVPRDPHTSRNAHLAYTQGLLTSVTANGTTYGTLSYHPNLLVSQIAHGNGMTETQSNDPNDMRRPAALSASGTFAAWSSGTYAYDGAGNVKAIGTSSFTYDKVSRLLSSSLFDGPSGGGNLKQQSYAFDAFGNLTSITTNGLLRNTPTSATTNRLTGAVSYDASGNLTSWNGAATYEYDAFNQMIHMTSGAEDWAYLYTADDERIWSYDVNRNASRWTLRDLEGKVLREYQNNQGRWGLATDYFYRDSLLLAAETLTGRRHYHLDHLGTPRLITRASGYPAAYHLYYPFGEEATAFNQDTERMKLTGHERDLASPAGAGDDLDYMHARFCSPMTGRFLSTDPADSARRSRPQSWNMYTYALDNPIRYVDPDGQDEREGVLAGVVVNNSSEVIWIAADVGKETFVIPLNPGESSATYFQDADAIVIDPGVVTPQGALLAASIEGESSGAFKIGVSVVEVEDSEPMDLDLDRSLGYLGSYLLGRAGFLDVKAAQQENKDWVIPKDRQAAEKKKEELRKQLEEREKKRNEKKQQSKPKDHYPR
jgi:RHS repeat-associated protein